HALYDALFAMGMKMYRAFAMELIDQASGFEAKIEAGIAGYMRFADENPELYPLLFERPVPGFVPSEESMTEIRGMADDNMTHFQQAMDAGMIDTGLTAKQAQDLFIAVMHGLTALK